jgi:hypothetical protein
MIDLEKSFLISFMAGRHKLDYFNIRDLLILAKKSNNYSGYFSATSRPITQLLELL